MASNSPPPTYNIAPSPKTLMNLESKSGSQDKASEETEWQGTQSEDETQETAASDLVPSLPNTPNGATNKESEAKTPPTSPKDPVNHTGLLLQLLATQGNASQASAEMVLQMLDKQSLQKRMSDALIRTDKCNALGITNTSTNK